MVIFALQLLSYLFHNVSFLFRNVKFDKQILPQVTNDTKTEPDIMLGVKTESFDRKMGLIN